MTTLQNLPAMIALAVLVDRLGGEVLISQADIDKIAYERLLEGWAENAARCSSSITRRRLFHESPLPDPA